MRKLCLGSIAGRIGSDPALEGQLEFIAEGGGQAFDLARFITDASSTPLTLLKC